MKSDSPRKSIKRLKLRQTKKSSFELIHHYIEKPVSHVRCKITWNYKEMMHFQIRGRQLNCSWFKIPVCRIKLRCFNSLEIFSILMQYKLRDIYFIDVIKKNKSQGWKVFSRLSVILRILHLMINLDLLLSFLIIGVFLVS